MTIDLSSVFWNFSVILAVAGGILIYFGKLISDTKVEKHRKNDLLISGLFFSLIFILFPVAISVYTYQKELILNIPLWILAIFQIILVGIYSKYFNYKVVITRYELIAEYNKRFSKKVKDSISKNEIKGKLLKLRPDISKKSLKFVNSLFKFFEDSRVLFVFAFCVIYTNVIFLNTENVIFISGNLILTFFNLSFIAVAFGLASAYYPKSKITLANGKEISGKTLKFGEFIHLITKDKKYFVNKDHVVVIEQNIMKDKNDSKK